MMEILDLLEDMNDTEREVYITLLLALRDVGKQTEP